MQAKIITGLLVMVCLILVTLLWQSYALVSNELSIQEQADLVPSSELPLNTVRTMPMNMSHYSVMIRAPLFAPNRVVAVIEKPPVALIQPSPATRVSPVQALPSLIGILTVGKAQRAFVLGDGDIEPVSLKINDNYHDWTLTAIHNDEVVMRYGDDEQTIGLDWALMALLYDSE
jgi:hypothetical protein